MKENENDINNMHELANEGWRQMHEMLRERGLSEDVPEMPAVKKMRWYPLLAACTLLVLIFSFPYILNDGRYSSPDYSVAKTVVSPSTNKPVTVTQSVKMISPVPETVLFSLQKNESSLPSKAIFINTKKETFTISIKPQSSNYFGEMITEKIPASPDLPAQLRKNLKDSTGADLPGVDKKKATNRLAKKVEFFAGAGVNVSSWNKSPMSFSLRGFNIHPGIGVVIPVTPKLSLHTGLWAFSTIHGKEATAKERELVNSLSTNIYYSVNTTSIIKASYFDVPLTVHYALDKNWSLGTGVQLSRLYKLNIREQRESYDYTDARFSTVIQQYTSTPSEAAAALRQRAEIKKYEPRFVAEASFRQKKWLVSAGYYYGLGKTITLKDADNTRHEYRNEYLKLAVQYQIGKK